MIVSRNIAKLSILLSFCLLEWIFVVFIRVSLRLKLRSFRKLWGCYQILFNSTCAGRSSKFLRISLALEINLSSYHYFFRIEVDFLKVRLTSSRLKCLNKRLWELRMEDAFFPLLVHCRKLIHMYLFTLDLGLTIFGPIIILDIPDAYFLKFWVVGGIGTSVWM